PPPPPPPPEALALDQNFPNPFRMGQQTTIPFTVPAAGGGSGARVELIVYNLLGQRVRTLVDGDIIAGEQAATWDGRTDSGVSIPAGVYVVRLAANGAERTIRVLVVR
ncbi:MAG: T9SS type A sorting domain-containing protein, partial [Gemmatimonadetes bacterium]|nr:T9SS type A sorting domain-containing protein [Gemmatimonadota bacterium]